MKIAYVGLVAILTALALRPIAHADNLGIVSEEIIRVLKQKTILDAAGNYSGGGGGGVASITGTANQINRDAATGAVTLSLPQSIGTGSSPTFANLTVDDARFAGLGGHRVQLDDGAGGGANFISEDVQHARGHWVLTGGEIRLASDAKLGFSSDTNASSAGSDVFFTRVGAGIISTDTTAKGDGLGTLVATAVAGKSGAPLTIFAGNNLDGRSLVRFGKSGAGTLILDSPDDFGWGIISNGTGGQLQLPGGAGGFCGSINWTTDSTYYGAKDLYISRSGINTFGVGTAAAGDHDGKIAMGGTTASGTLAPTWTNSPTALIGAQNPYTWLKFVAPDGTDVYVPAWK